MNERDRLSVPMTDALRSALISATLSTQGYDAKWKAMQASGATDEEIKDLLCSAFGIWGGGPGYVYSGGASPRFWHPSDREWTDETRERVRMLKPTLSGRTLILAVRMIYGIDDTGQMRADESGQMELFA